MYLSNLDGVTKIAVHVTNHPELGTWKALRVEMGRFRGTDVILGMGHKVEIACGAVRIVDNKDILWLSPHVKCKRSTKERLLRKWARQLSE